MDRKLNNITEAICNGIFNTMTQAKMVELTNISNDLQVKIIEEESRVIEPLKKAKVIAFLKNYAKIVQCANRTESLESKKALFDLFIKEVIFDGDRFLIVMKTTDDLDTDKSVQKDTKKETIRKKFELLRFGDLIGTRTRVYAVRGRRLNRLTIRPLFNCLCSIAYFSFESNCF